MSSTPSLTTKTEPTSNAPAQTAPKRPFSVQRLVAWGLPLSALCILLGAVWMAVISGQLGWTAAGLAVYCTCFVMWLALAVFEWAQAAVKVAGPTSSVAPTQTTEREAPYRESLLFARFAGWFLPLLAVIGLTVSACLAAVARQQNWLTAGTLSFSGCFLVWSEQLLRPFYRRSKTTPASNPGTVPPPSVPPAPLKSIVLLFLSLLVLSATVLFATHSAEFRWLVAASVVSVGYLVLVIAPTIRATPQVQGAARLIWVAFLAIAMPALTAGVGLALYLRHLSWIGASLIGFFGCLLIWIAQVIEGAPKGPFPEPYEGSRPSMIPALLLTAMLVLLGFALYEHEISALKAAMLAVLGGLALWFSWMFVSSVERDGPPQIESNWGGLGGGGGGWRCSASLIYGLCALSFAVCAGVTFLKVQASTSTTGVTTNSGSMTPAGSNSMPGGVSGSASKTIPSGQDATSSSDTNKPSPATNQNSK